MYLILEKLLIPMRILQFCEFFVKRCFVHLKAFFYTKNKKYFDTMNSRICTDIFTHG